MCTKTCISGHTALDVRLYPIIARRGNKLPQSHVLNLQLANTCTMRGENKLLKILFNLINIIRY